MKRLRLASLMVCALAACGGGVDWLRIEPQQLTEELYERDPFEFGVTVTIVAKPPGASGTVYPRLVDPDGVLRSDWKLIPEGDTQWYIYMRISESLTEGRYRGKIFLRLCEDDPPICDHPVSGSRWSIDYDFTIREGDHLTPLAKLPGVGAWSTWQGNANHTGSIAATLDPAAFTRRFGHPGDVSEAVTADGLVYVTVKGPQTISPPFTLLALRESDGGVAWSKSLGAPRYAGPPAVGNGQVYVSAGSSFRVFDAATGDVLSTVDTSAQYSSYGSPEVKGTAVYAGAESLGGVLRFDADTLTAGWSTPFDLLNSEPYSFTVDESHVYAVCGLNLRLFDPATGEYQTAIPDDPQTMFHAKETGGLVLGDGGLGFRSYLGSTGDDHWQGRLIGYDLTAPGEKWALSDHFTSAPVLANGVLYVVNGEYLEARDPTTGARSWRWAPTGGLFVPNRSISYVVVAGNLAFVSDYVNTFAVDLATHQTVWAYPDGGPLAISDNGVLYISVRTGTLAAINLQ